MQRIIYGKRQIHPSKIVCVGRNYVAHIEELGNEIPGELVVFMKPNSALTDSLQSEHGGEALHYEAELCFLVESATLVAVGLGLDLTKRQLQSRLKEKSLPWERAKAFDGSVLFSEFVALGDDLSGLELELSINGEMRQCGGVSLMLHKPDAILREISEFCSLEDGDIVMTGTPAGVGEVHSGDDFAGTVRDGTKVLLETAWTAA